MTILSYHSDQSLKARFIAHVERHRLEDSILQGLYGETDENGHFTGCAVGCSLRSLDQIDGREPREDYQRHQELAERLGVPLVLAYLEDRIFEGLPAADAKLWPTLFARAIPVGADMSLVWPRFAHWLLVDETSGVIRFAGSEQARVAIRRVAELFERQIAGGQVSGDEWREARYAAHAAHAASPAAAAYAASPAASAAYAASPAASAASDAADAAASAYAASPAADAASDAADAARARRKHYQTMAAMLLRIMGEVVA